MGGAFEARSVWITGASSGLGRAMALEFARRGAHVALSARRVAELEAVAREIEGAGGRALVVPCDCTHEDAIEGAVARVVETFGRLDVAVANAGYSVGGPVERVTAEQWRRQLDVNVVGVALTAKHAIPHLRHTRGRLALVGSVAALALFPGFAPYQASKAAVLALGRTLAMELAAEGVSCTTLQPGFVATDIARVDNDGRRDPAREDKRPAALMWEVEPAARVMVDAIERRRVEATFTGHGKVGAFLGRHAPWLFQLLGPRLAKGSAHARDAS
ncbi:MAG: SDR family NAD(P)-dependent oxidoreductase [Myxococcales bacterium]|nr:SDR family NAD(P)-dependent oxidoreductase [Myxococcales bacterium]